ncbi:MAG: hypothetical protein IKK33_06355 [Lachnospiraceae bacterium]|nr:hypothetical protein [Lachnospiraceae bacterium]
MRAVLIKIKDIPDFYVRDIEITCKVNEHSRIKLTGMIKQANCESIINYCMSTNQLKVYIEDESVEQVIFIGTVYNVEIVHKGYEDVLILELISETINLDMEQKKRTFQKEDRIVLNLMESISRESGAFIHTEVGNEKVGTFLAQYNETDWEFLKRTASLIGEVLLPIVNLEGIRYQMGLKSNELKELSNVLEYSIENVLSEMRNKNSKGLDLVENEAKQFRITTRDILYLGDRINFQNNELFVYEVIGKMVDEELTFTYSCRSKSFFKVPYTPNEKIIGASLEGEVASVSGTMIRVTLDCDNNNLIRGSKEFPFATVASSKDGSGWYCMPEEEDRVRLYFPSEREKDAYVISAVHLDVVNTGITSEYVQNNPILSQLPEARTNPEYKSIKNKYNKELIFAPTCIIITNNEDMMIALDDTEGIIIDTLKPLNIHSNEKIVMTSEDSIVIEATHQILLEQGEAGVEKNMIDMNLGITTIKGKEVRLQERK